MDKVITALTPQKNDPNRVNLYLDEEFAFGISAAAVAGVHVGDQLSETQVTDLRNSSQLEHAFQSITRYLSFRPRTRKELEDRLASKGVSPHIITVVVEKVVEMGWVNDETFAKLWLESRALSRPKSHRMLKYELTSKGIAPELLEESLAEVSDDETLAFSALELKSRRWKGLEKSRFLSLAGGFLGRRGFTYEVIRKTLAEYWDSRLENIDNE